MDLASILLGGLASGMVLFVVSVGLSVTMGLMGFVNLAHGGFAMLGGYAVALAMRHWGMPFFAALALAFAAVAALAVLLERTLYARLYRAGELDQVLFTIGLVYAMTAAVTLGVGPETQTVVLPEWLRGQTWEHGLGDGQSSERLVDDLVAAVVSGEIRGHRPEDSHIDVSRSYRDDGLPDSVPVA